MEQYYEFLFIAAAVALGLMLLVCLFRAVRGPKTPDRVISVNMIGTISIGLIAIMAVLLGENYLADVALVYALLSFISVVLLCKIYIGIRHAAKEREEKRHD